MTTNHHKWPTIVATMIVTISTTGCLGGDARVEIAAANLLEVANDSLAAALTEYHNEILAADAQKEHNAIRAFTNRLTANPETPPDEKTVNLHTRHFTEALSKLRADTKTEWNRHITLMGNLRILQDAATTMRQLAIDSLSLEDETKRYLSDALVQLKEYRARDKLDPTPVDH